MGPNQKMSNVVSKYSALPAVKIIFAGMQKGTAKDVSNSGSLPLKSVTKIVVPKELRDPEGSDDTSLQRAKKVIEKFHFIVPPKGVTVHCNMINAKLQLQVDIFCDDIKHGVLEWLLEIRSESAKSEATKSLLRIQYPSPDGGINF